jgi:flagellar basal body-associated protein FliL
MGLFSQSGKLKKTWKDAKDKVDSKVLKELRFEEDLSPNLDKLEEAVGQVTELRSKLLMTCASYKGKAELKGLKDLSTALDSIRDQVNTLVGELGKTAAVPKSE